eukprot:maker-scaffold470_size172058-snap-gene-0.28 protein:Tk09899 transcript:maker-scaffold470_size172058-snap-gene-0.28-mRNA-1 annotation:"fructokinase"
MPKFQLRHQFVVLIATFLLLLAQLSNCYVVNSEEYQPAAGDTGLTSASDEYAEEDLPVCPFHPACWQSVLKNPGMAASIIRAAQKGQLLQRQARSYDDGTRRFYSAYDRFSKKSRFGTVRRSRTSARGHPRSDARFSSFKVADAQIRLSDGIPVISDRSTHEILSDILLLATKRIRSLRTP